MRLKMTLEYDGTGFRGWAAQPGLRTVEGVVRDALDRVFSRWSELAVAATHEGGIPERANASAGSTSTRNPITLNPASPAGST